MLDLAHRKDMETKYRKILLGLWVARATSGRGAACFSPVRLLVPCILCAHPRPLTPARQQSTPSHTHNRAPAPPPAPRGGTMCIAAYAAVVGLFLRIKMPGYLVSSHGMDL